MTIGERVKHFRSLLGIAQGDLASRSGIDQANLSRLEGGTSLSPRDETLRAIAKGLASYSDSRLPSEHEIHAQLESLRNAGVGARPLTIGFAHCLWAAPLVDLRSTARSDMQAGRPAPVQLTSRSEPENEKSAELLLGSVEAVDVPAGQMAPSKRTLQDRGATANELVTLLRREVLDGIVVARDVIQGQNRSLLTPCVEILHAVGGSMLLLVAKKDVLPSFPDDGAGDLSALLQALRNDRGDVELPLYYAPATNAETHLNWLQGWLKKNPGPEATITRPRPWLDPRPASLGHWRQVEDAARSALAEHKAIGLIAWDPHVAWLKDALGSEAESVSASGYLHQLGGLSDVPLPYVSFVLCLRKSIASHSATDPRFNNFLRSLEDQCRAITPEGAEEALVGTVKRVASYFQIDPAYCEEELRGLEFRVRYEPEWVDLLRNAQAGLT
jgi:transcriptional regulator with XRE-family HTH domain